MLGQTRKVAYADLLDFAIERLQLAPKEQEAILTASLLFKDVDQTFLAVQKKNHVSLVVDDAYFLCI